MGNIQGLLCKWYKRQSRSTLDYEYRCGASASKQESRSIVHIPPRHACSSSSSSWCVAAVLLWWGRGGAGLKLLWSDMWSLSIVFSRKVDCDVTCQLVWGRWLVSEKVKTRNWGYRCLVLSFKFK